MLSNVLEIIQFSVLIFYNQMNHFCFVDYDSLLTKIIVQLK